MVNTTNMYESFGSVVADALDCIDKVFAPTYHAKGIAKDLAAADTVIRNAETALDQVPANVWVETAADGLTKKGIEVAIPGKTKENVKISESFVGDDRYLKITITSPDAEEAPKAESENSEAKPEAPKRNYSLRKIKGMTRLSFKVLVEDNFDLDALKAKVENGLLTVTIPQKPEPEPVPLKEFDVE